MKSSSEPKRMGTIFRIISIIRRGHDPQFAATEERLDQLARELKAEEDLKRMNGYGRGR